MKGRYLSFWLCFSLPLGLFACDTPINIRSHSNVPLSKIIEEIAAQCRLKVVN